MAVATIENQLGAADGRFFGTGYSRVRHDYTLRALRADGADYIASVLYPKDWSEKDGAAQAPHLTSIDAMAVAVSIAEDYLSGPRSRGAVPLADRSIQSCVLIPGAQPVTDLAQIPVQLDLEHSEDVDTDLAATVAIGAFKVKLHIHQNQAASHASPDALNAKTYFGGGFRAVARELGLVETRDGQHFEARTRVRRPALGTSIRPGIDHAYHEASSMIDALAFCAQVGQVAIYAQDGLERARTDTLWLRRARFVRTATAGIDATGVCRVRVDRTNLIKREGSEWRTADLHGQYGDVEVQFRLAHALHLVRDARPGVV